MNRLRLLSSYLSVPVCIQNLIHIEKCFLHLILYYISFGKFFQKIIYVVYCKSSPFVAMTFLYQSNDFFLSAPENCLLYFRSVTLRLFLSSPHLRIVCFTSALSHYIFFSGLNTRDFQKNWCCGTPKTDIVKITKCLYRFCGAAYQSITLW